MQNLCTNNTFVFNCTESYWNTSELFSCFNGTIQIFVDNNGTCQSELLTDFLVSVLCENVSSVEFSPSMSTNCFNNDTNNMETPRRKGIAREFRALPLVTSTSAIVVCFWLLIQIWRYPQLHTSVNKIVASLCACGIINSALSLIFSWPYELIEHPVPCLAYICAYCATFIVTFLHFMIISLDRYLHIIHPFIHIRLTSTNLPLVLCIVVVWVVSLLMAFVPFWVELKPYWKMACAELSLVLPFWLYTLIYIGVLVAATTTAGIAYINIFRVWSRHLRAIEQIRHIGLTHRESSVGGGVSSVGDNLGHRKSTAETQTGDDNPRPGTFQKEGNGARKENRGGGSGGNQQWARTVARNGEPKRNGEDQTNYKQKSKAKRAATKARSALIFVALYIYYFMSWAPNTIISTYVAYTNKPQPQALRRFLDFIPMFSSTGYCLLYMFLEKDVRRVTVGKILVFFRRRRVVAGTTEETREVNTVSSYSHHK